MIIGLLGFSSSSGVKLVICIFSENSQFQVVFNLHVVEHGTLKEFFLFSLYHWLLLQFDVQCYVCLIPPPTHIRLSGLKKNHKVTRDFFFQEPIYYVHSPQIEELEWGMRMRKVAGEGQLDKHLKSAKSLPTHSLALNTLHLLSPAPPTQLNPPTPTLPSAPSCHLLLEPFLISLGKVSSFPLTSQITQFFFLILKNFRHKKVKSIKSTNLTNVNILWT